jgi:tetratricopeptide (TPR) repeat protein
VTAHLLSRRIAAFVLAALTIAWATLSLRHEEPAPVLAAEQQSRIVLSQPDAVCATCHQAIYEKYEKTSMARGGGIATDGLLPGKFTHMQSGISYSVFMRDGAAWMSYTRPFTDPHGPLNGERRLDLYIGSGHRGRTYLYNEDGRWYELPINFYTRRNVWAMTPAFDNAGSMPAPLPVDANCLHCHATDLQTALPDARNHYNNLPFRQAGIGCSACHGDPAQHLAQHGHGPIVNPDKLQPALRDSACIQCHLEGDAVVYRPGRSLVQFVPGDNLADIAVYFVKANQQGGGRRATSQYEALLRSACKRASGDKLTCTTCHDPHSDPRSDPTQSERVSYFRSRCLSCHTAPAMATHHAEEPDCAKCHMPTLSTVDISHEQVTDHDIEVHLKSQPSPRDPKNSGIELVPVGDFKAGNRELGLAYAQFAERGDRKAGETALRLLTTVPPAIPADVEVLVRLGFLQQLNGDVAAARASYQSALAANPWEPTSLGNLAVLDAGSGKADEAIQLLKKLVDADPSQTRAGLNLAFIECELHQTEQAKSILNRLARSNSDDPQLRQFIETGTYLDRHCALPGVTQ